MKKLIPTLVIALIGLLIVFWMSAVIVEPGKAVVAYHSIIKDYEVLGGEKEGLFLVFRPVHQMKTYDVKRLEYTMSSTANEGAKRRSDQIEVLSGDNLEMAVDATIYYQYQVENLFKLHDQVRHPEQKVIRPKTRAVMRDVFADYEATVAAAEKREEIQQRVEKKLGNFFDENYIDLLDLQIREIRLPDQVREAIQEKKQEQQAAQKMEYTIERRRKQKKAKRLEGEAEAAKKVAAAEGEAEAIKIISERLKDNPLYIQWKGIDRLNPKANIVLGSDTNDLILNAEKSE